MRTSAHAAFKLQFPLVIVTKYRRKVLTEAMLAQAQHIFGEVLGRRAYYRGSVGDAILETVKRYIEALPWCMRCMRTALGGGMRSEFVQS